MVSVRRVWLGEAVGGGVVSVPALSAALTVMLGEEPRLASEPPEVDFSCACQVCAPVDDVAVAPGPPPPVAPHVILKVFPAARRTDATVSAWPTTPTGPPLQDLQPPC